MTHGERNCTNWTEEETTLWESRIQKTWSKINDVDEEEFNNHIEKLVEERGLIDSIALFELACLKDSFGKSDLAIPLYQQALEIGLDGIRRRRAVIQMSSSLRNCGNVEKGISLLEEEFSQPSDELDDAVSAFYALLISEVGQEDKALGIALSVLSKHLPRYNVSLANYAEKFSKGTEHPGRPEHMK